MKPKLAISFSGGRSSAVMTKLCLDEYSSTHEIVVTFANTGCEHPATLDFVRDCDRYWNFGTVWLEAVIDPTPGVGVGIRW
jgi:3'-phosphoadenosine 5'-phosphosulfate sulfotransferase (PAPS reductase)/FAD synthetase